jgi:hypothetical protein
MGQGASLSLKFSGQLKWGNISMDVQVPSDYVRLACKSWAVNGAYSAPGMTLLLVFSADFSAFGTTFTCPQINEEAPV